MVAITLITLFDNYRMELSHERKIKIGDREKYQKMNIEQNNTEGLLLRVLNVITQKYVTKSINE